MPVITVFFLTSVQSVRLTERKIYEVSETKFCDIVYLVFIYGNGLVTFTMQVTFLCPKIRNNV